MPTLIIKTNAALAADNCFDLLQSASETVAEMLGKPERYVMVMLEQNAAMYFAGSTAPLAYLELKSLGLPEQRSAEFSATLCDWVSQQLGVSPDRVYVGFSAPPRHLFGFDRSTF